MLGSVFPFEEFDVSTQVFGAEDAGGILDLWSACDSYQDNFFDVGTPFVLPDDQPSFSNETGLDAIAAAIQSSGKRMETDDIHHEKPSVSESSDASQEKSSTSESFDAYREMSSMSESSDLLELKEKDITKTFSSLDHPKERVSKLSNHRERELSTEEIMRVAASHFVPSSAHEQPISVLTDEELKDVDLVILLLQVADEVRKKHYDRARNLLRSCYALSTSTGNPVQRVVHYFSGALQARIDQETGGNPALKRPREKSLPAKGVLEAMQIGNPMQLVVQEKVPFPKLMQFTSVQTIIDSMDSSRRIHIIDLSIKHGLHWTILMQSLAMRSTCPVDYLRISAVGTSEEAITTTGRRLVNFADTLNLAFDFKAVIVSDIGGLREDMFELEEGESVGVYTSMDMNPLLVQPESLDNLMRVIQKINPCVMTVVDIEAKHNSQSFIDRFVEALYFYSSFFDCLDSFMDRGDGDRLVIEGSFHSQGIKNIVAAESSERVVRHVGVSVWRSYFARFGLVEAELNDWIPYQAGLLVDQFDHGRSCTLVKNGESLVVGWKGTPLVFVSAWKFQSNGESLMIAS